MPKSALVPGGTVTSIQGRATVIPAGQGAAHVLKVGDTVQAGDAVLTSMGTNLVITDDQGHPWTPRDLILALAQANAGPTAKAGKSLHAKVKAALTHQDDAGTSSDKDTDQAIQALDRGDADTAPAAGGGGGDGTMTPGLRVDRVIEIVSTQEFDISATERSASASDNSQAAVLDQAVADAVAKLSATDDTFTTQKSTVVGLPVLNNDGIDASTAPHVTAINGESISPGGQVVVDHGVVQMSSTGALTFAPDYGFVGNLSFSYTVATSSGQTAEAAVTVSVMNPPAAPVAHPDLLVTQENQAVTFYVTGNDEAGSQGPLHITLVDGQAVATGTSVAVDHGTVRLNGDGSLTFTPDAHYAGDISFAYTVTDQGGQTAATTVNVQVTPVNDAPVVGDLADPTFDPMSGGYAVSTEEDKAISGQVTASDVDGDTLSFTKGSDPAHGSVVVNADGTWTYTPAKDYNGSDSFTVTVSDGHDGKTTSTITVGVNAVNDAPTASTNYSVVTPEDQPISGKVTGNDVDGDALSYAKGTDPAHGSVVVNADGTWTYTPAKDYNGSDSFTVTVSDGQGGTATSTVTVGVTAGNDAPVIGSASDPTFNAATGNYTVATSEDQPLTGKVTATDIDGDTLTFAKGTDPAHGSVVVSADGAWTYTPAKDYNGSDSFTVTVSDGHGGTTTSTITVGVTAINDAPTVATSYNIVTPEDQPISGKVTGQDVDGDALSYAKGTDPAHGSVVVNADGTWTYTPAKDYNGSDSFTVTTSDGQGGTATSTITVGVTAVNDAPTSANYSTATPEDQSVSGQVVGNDVDGDALSYAKGTDPIHGSVVVNADGTWTYTPAKDYNGSDSFTVTVSDGQGGTATSTVMVGVTPVNDAPVIGSASDPTFNPATGNYTVATNEDQPLSGKVTAMDVDGDTLTFTKGIDPAHGSVVVNADGTWTYTPAKDYNGSDSFTVTVSDGHGGTTTSTITVGVTPVNDAPVIGSASDPTFNPATGNYTVATNEDQPLSGKVTATDVDGDTLTFSKGTDPTHGSVVVNADGTWTYTPAKDYNGSDSFTVTVSDGQGGTTTSTVTVGVTAVNDNPVLGSASDPTFNAATGNYTVATSEDQPLSGKVTATDVDGDTLTFAKGTDPAHGSVVVSADGTWTYTPAGDYTGSDSFTVNVSDGQGGTATSTITVGVTPVNDAPVIGSASDPTFSPATGNYTVATSEDQPLSGKVTATDVDGDTLTFAKGTDPAYGSVVVNADGIWTYTPAKDYNGSDSFTVTVSDGHGGTTTSTITVGVTPANDAPTVAANYTVDTLEDQPISGKVSGQDVDGDALSYAKGTDPAHGSVLVNADGTWTYTPAKDYNGSDSFTVTVSDGQGGTAISTVTVGVTAVNDNPVMGSASDPAFNPATGNYTVATSEDQHLSGKVTATDVDGDALTFSKSTDPAHGSVVVNTDGTWTYTPAKDYNGSDSFTVTVSDGQGGTATSTVTVGVTAVNDNPVIGSASDPTFNAATRNYTVATSEDQPLSGKVTATDVDGDTLTFAKGTDPTHGSVVVNADGTWTYTPAKDYNGSDSFTVTVSDGQGGTATSTVTVGVTAGNDNPVIDSASDPTFNAATGNYTVATSEDQPLSGKVTATDVDGDALTFAKGTDPAYGSVVVNADGTWTYTPDRDYNGSDSFTVTVSDGQGGTATSTVTVGVTAVNDNPVIGSASDPTFNPATGNYTVATSEDQPLSGKVTATDVDGNSLTFVKGIDPAHGSVVVNADGTWTYTPAKDYNGSDSFTVTVSDGQGGTATSTITVGVTPVNDPPTVATSYNVVTLEDQPVSGKVTGNDVDGDALSYAKGNDPAHGSVVVNADGTWTYTPAKDYNGSDSFTVTVSDGQGGTATSTITVGVTAINDAPVIGSASDPTFNAATGNYAVATNEDQPLSGKVTATDVDGDSLTFVKGIDPAHGSVVVNADGSWTYTPAKDYNGSDSFTVTAADGHGATTSTTVSVGIQPVNDPATLSSGAATLTEDTNVNAVGKLLASGTLTVSDVDAGEAAFQAQGGTAGAYGTFTLASDGTWTYAAANSQPLIQSLGAGQHLTEVFVVKSIDGTSSAVTITINGSNDAAVIPAVTASVTEDVYPAGTTTLSTGGIMSITDADTGEAFFVPQSSTPGTYGTFSLNANGAWTYAAAANQPAIQALPAGQSLTETFTVKSVDGTLSSVTVKVIGTNDAAVISSGTGSVTEDTSVNALGKLTTSGTLSVTDVDTGEASFQTQSGTAGNYGTFTLASNGAWTYSANNSQTAIQSLGAGQSLTESFTVKSLDGTTSTVKVTINGTNDAPILTLDANGSSGATAGNFNTRFFENGAPVSIADADLTITDVDSGNLAGATIKLTNAQLGDVLTAGTLPTGITASAYNASTGVLTLSGSASAASYQAAIKAITFSNAGDYPSAVDRTVTVTVTDGSSTSNSSTSTISIALQNDAPTPTLSVTPVGYWTFNDVVGSTTTYNRNSVTQVGTLADDSSTGGSGLPVFSAVEQRSAASGNYINFTDTGDRINISTSVTQPLMGTATMTFWLKTSMAGTSNGNGNSWDLASIIGSEQNGGGNDIQWGAINANGKIGLGLGNVAGVYSTTSINDNVWHNVAITRSAVSGLVQVFVDGKLEATGSPTDPAFTATMNRLTAIGATNQFGNDASGTDQADKRYYTGMLDDLHIYDRVLTADQITAIRAVENGFQDHAIANDGSTALRLAVTGANFTSLSVTGLETGMTITDGVHTATSIGNDTAIDLTGWTLGSLQVTNAGTHSATLAFTATDNVNGDTHTTTQYLNVVTGSTILTGAGTDDMLAATGSNAAFIAGGAGQDNITGGSGNDRLLGQSGDDNLTGNGGHDVLIGGAGNDLLTGGAGNDVFRWEFGDGGAKGSPTVDVISDFSSAAGNKDVLDLRDLLQGDNHVGTNTGNLSNFIHFEYTGADTVIHLSSQGGFSGGYSAANEDQTIVLRSVDLTVGGALTTDQQIIKDLLTKGQLNVD